MNIDEQYFILNDKKEVRESNRKDYQIFINEGKDILNKIFIREFEIIAKFTPELFEQECLFELSIYSDVVFDIVYKEHFTYYKEIQKRFKEIKNAIITDNYFWEN